jgi:hypothetical protein
MDDRIVFRGKQAIEALGGWKFIVLLIVLLSINVMSAWQLISQ